MKRLKLLIAKFERALMMQVLEMKNLNESRNHVFYPATKTTMYPDFIAINKSLDIDVRVFKDNAERDEYLKKILGWISEEQFGGSGELEIGQECLVSDDGKEWFKRIFAGKSAKQLGEGKRFLAVNILNDNALRRWKYARPIGAQPTIDGEIYTWEGEQ